MASGTPRSTRPPALSGTWQAASSGQPRNSINRHPPDGRRLELLFSAIWGFALLADCVARLVGAYTLPVTTMAWLSTVMILGAVGLGVVAGGAAARPIEKMAEAAAGLG